MTKFNDIIPEEFDFQEVVSQKLEDYQFNKKNMKSNFLTLNFKDIYSAVISAVIVAVLGYIVSVTSIYSVDFSKLLDIALMTAVTSLLKSFLTTEDGSFAGLVGIK